MIEEMPEFQNYKAISRTKLELPESNQRKMRLAKFLNYQHDDFTWFQVSKLVSDKVSITLRRTGVEPEVVTLSLDILEADALYNLLTTILERKLPNE